MRIASAAHLPTGGIALGGVCGRGARAHAPTHRSHHTAHTSSTPPQLTPNYVKQAEAAGVDAGALRLAPGVARAAAAAGSPAADDGGRHADEEEDGETWEDVLEEGEDPWFREPPGASEAKGGQPARSCVFPLRPTHSAQPFATLSASQSSPPLPRAAPPDPTLVFALNSNQHPVSVTPETAAPESAALLDLPSPHLDEAQEEWREISVAQLEVAA